MSLLTVTFGIFRKEQFAQKENLLKFYSPSGHQRFYQLLGLSFWQHPFTAEDLLVSKWSVPMKKQNTVQIEWHEDEYIFSNFSFFNYS